MANVQVKWTAEESAAKSNDEKNHLVDEEIEAFSSFMADLNNPLAQGALEDFEKALVKSYLVAKLSGKIP